MIIVSQDKKAIHNLDNILSLQIESCNGFYGIFVYDAINDNTKLGEYKTETRAKEVLNELTETRAIVEIYKCCDNDIQNIFDKRMLEENLIFDTYEMPEE